MTTFTITVPRALLPILPITAALSFLALFAAGQEPDSGLRARQLFYTSKPVTQKPRARVNRPAPAKTNDPQPASREATTSDSKAPEAAVSESQTPEVPKQAPYLGLRYSVLQPGTNGQLQEIDSEKTFHTDEHFRLKLASNSSAYLYVVMQGSLGNWDVLYPSRTLAEPDRRINAGEPLVIPSGDDFKFDKDPGTERLFIVLSRNPEKDFDQLLQSVQRRESNTPTAGSIQNTQIASLRQQLAPRGIVRERVTRTENGNEEAVYVANASLDRNSRVITDVVLKHE